MSKKHERLARIAEAFEHLKMAEAAFILAFESAPMNAQENAAMQRIKDTKDAISNVWFLLK